MTEWTLEVYKTKRPVETHAFGNERDAVDSFRSVREDPTVYAALLYRGKTIVESYDVDDE
jgi:hypothetical protein